MLAPENVQAMLIRSLGALKMVERVFAGKHGAKARQIVRQAHRHRVRGQEGARLGRLSRHAGANLGRKGLAQPDKSID